MVVVSQWKLWQWLTHCLLLFWDTQWKMKRQWTRFSIKCRPHFVVPCPTFLTSASHYIQIRVSAVIYSSAVFNLKQLANTSLTHRCNGLFYTILVRGFNTRYRRYQPELWLWFRHSSQWRQRISARNLVYNSVSWIPSLLCILFFSSRY